MPCRGCKGLDACLGGLFCCLGFEQDCGEGCTGLAEGDSRIQINAAGELEICSNIGGVCNCLTASTGADTFAFNGLETITHIDTSGNIITVDICADVLPNCAIEQLGNVTAGAGVDEILVFNGANWIPQAFANDTFVFNGTNTITHTSTAGVVTAVNICTQVLPNCAIEQLGNVTAGATANQILVSDGANWNPQNFANDTFVYDGVSTITHTSTAGIITTVDICAQVLPNCSITQLGDVDTLTVPPAIGDHFIWDGTNWVPDSPPVRTYIEAAQVGNINAPSATWTGMNYNNVTTDVLGEWSGTTFTAATDKRIHVCAGWSMASHIPLSLVAPGSIRDYGMRAVVNGGSVGNFARQATYTPIGATSPQIINDRGCMTIDLLVGDTVTFEFLHDDPQGVLVVNPDPDWSSLIISEVIY